ncbi:glycosyltransferase family 9 protein [Bacteroides congonensis]
MKKKKTILIIRTSALGDVAMCIPVIYSLAERYPDLDIKVLTQPFFARLFVNAPANISFILADWKGKHKGARGICRLLKELLMHRIDCVADLHNVLRSWLIDACFLLKGIPVRIVDKERRKRKALLSSENREIRQRNYVQRYSDVFGKLQLPVVPDFTSLLSLEELNSACLPIPQPDDGKCLIGIAPFARYQTKTYPLPLMEEVIGYLNDKGYHLFLFGSQGKEEKVLKTWEQKYKSCIALPGLLTIREELLLMGHMDVMLTMDSANMHMASLAGTPVVSLWGSTTPACGFLGWRQSEKDALCLHLPCQPCSVSGRKKCPLQHFSCMMSISPKEVCNRIELNLPSKNECI